MLRSILSDSFRPSPASILYHYTSWKAAKSILKTQRFWATAFDCTKDKTELITADDTIIEVAKEVKANARNYSRLVFERFISSYSEMRISASIPIFLSCFSAAKDDPYQWSHYAEEGSGVCLALRLLNEEPPEDPRLTVITVEVDYSAKGTVRKKLREDFNRASLEFHNNRRHLASFPENISKAVLTLTWIAGGYAMSAKAETFAPENEIRRLVFVNYGFKFPPDEYTHEDGRLIRYLAVPLRRPGKKISLAQIFIGPNDTQEGPRKAEQMLSEAGYAVGDPEYPEILPSAVELR
jgi:hypothetical protein